MKVVVFGAGGKVGSLVVSELLARNDSVTAFIHHKSTLQEQRGLRFVQGDIRDKASVEKAITGNDAVVSALSSWHTPSKDILSAGMRTIIPAMRAASIERIVSLTGADARAHGDKIGLVHGLSHPVLNIVAGKVLRDGEEHIRLLAESDLRWTVIRSPIMNDHGQIEDYILSDDRPLPWTTINRQSVARSMVWLLDSDTYDRRAPFIVRRGTGH